MEPQASLDSKLAAISFIWPIHSVRLANQSRRHCWQKQYQSCLLNSLQAQDIWEMRSVCYWKAAWVWQNKLLNMNLCFQTINTKHFHGFGRSKVKMTMKEKLRQKIYGVWNAMTTNVYLLKINWTVMPYHNHIHQSGRHSPAPRRTGNWQECMCGQTNTQIAPGHMCPLDL